MNLNRFPLLSTVAFAFALSGCATNGDPRDPLEPMNRGIYKFNDGVDKAVLKPVAQGYKAVLPSPVRTGVTNFFSNIDDLFVAANNLLQFKLNAAASDVGRIIANTTFGIAGIFDVASGWGMEKHNEDFGQTLGYWGVGDGPFLMLPLLGPSNVRDSAGLLIYYKLDPVVHLHNIPLRNSLIALRFVNRRANLLDAEKVLDEAALDPYTFLRDAYIQQRRNLIYDGSPPRENSADEDEAPVPKKTEAINPQTLTEASVPVQTTAVAQQKVDEKIDATTPAVAAVAETPSNDLPAVLARLFRGGNATGWQE
jgi:phospholipid-binding lipoprotein MlaA